jgi:hypothetical protein
MDVERQNNGDEELVVPFTVVGECMVAATKLW